MATLRRHSGAFQSDIKKENARRAIPALRLQGRRHPGRYAEEELWDRRSEDGEREDIQSLTDAGEYDHAAKLANEAIAETVARYIHEAILEKEE
jgi:hypothetical protein